MPQQQQLQPEPQRTSTEPPRYDEQTLRQAIQLADRLQAEHKERYSAEDIEKIAAEIGVQPEFVHKALNEIETKHDDKQKAVVAPPKPITPPVSQQVGQVVQQASKTAGETAKNVMERVEKGTIPELKKWETQWWSIGWMLMVVPPAIIDEIKIISGLAGLFAMVGTFTYIGFGIFLSNTLKRKQKEAVALHTQLTQGSVVPPVPAPPGVAPPVRYSVETSGVSREELLAQMVEIQKRLEGERVRKTFLSLDVVSSSEMKRSADELIVEYSFNQFRRFVEDIVLAEGGQVQSTAGDGTMAMFSSDTAAVRASLRLQSELASFNAQHNRLPRPFHIRCGINAGEVALLPGQPIGHLQSAVIDRAAALQKSAPPDDIVVSGDLSAEGLATLGRYGRHADSPEGGVRGFSWRAGF
jgi:class 3 adenylate cyclase